jgi:hypothetical protein
VAPLEEPSGRGSGDRAWKFGDLVSVEMVLRDDAGGGVVVVVNGL